MSLKELADHALNGVHVKVESAAPAVSYATNGFVFAWGALTFNQIMMLIGTVFAILTYFTSLYFQRKRDKREQEFHQHRILVELAKAEKAADRADIKDWRDDHDATK
ncbi:MAG: HP1 family phage holin [Marinobacter sp.]|nr:HP1 family phage holin [Marinobacter sp.]